MTTAKQDLPHSDFPIPDRRNVELEWAPRTGLRDGGANSIIDAVLVLLPLKTKRSLSMCLTHNDTNSHILVQDDRHWREPTKVHILCLAF